MRACSPIFWNSPGSYSRSNKQANALLTIAWIRLRGIPRRLQPAGDSAPWRPRSIGLFCIQLFDPRDRFFAFLSSAHLRFSQAPEPSGLAGHDPSMSHLRLARGRQRRVARGGPKGLPERCASARSATVPRAVGIAIAKGIDVSL